MDIAQSNSPKWSYIFVFFTLIDIASLTIGSQLDISLLFINLTFHELPLSQQDELELSKWTFKNIKEEKTMN